MTNSKHGFRLWPQKVHPAVLPLQSMERMSSSGTNQIIQMMEDVRLRVAAQRLVCHEERTGVVLPAGSCSEFSGAVSAISVFTKEDRTRYTSFTGYSNANSVQQLSVDPLSSAMMWRADTKQCAHNDTFTSWNTGPAKTDSWYKIVIPKETNTKVVSGTTLSVSLNNGERIVLTFPSTEERDLWTSAVRRCVQLTHLI